MSYTYEEQEQIAQLRHFWQRWGTWISAAALAVAVAIAAYYGWQWWQNDQAAKAAAAYEQVQAALQSNDPDKIAAAWAAMQQQVPDSTYAGMAALAVAKALHDAGRNVPAEQALQWAIDHASSDAVKAVARLNLANLRIDAKQYAQAQALLSTVPERSFTPLFDWRRGDLAALQGQRDAARKAFEAALAALPADAPERAAITARLQSVGGEVK